MTLQQLHTKLLASYTHDNLQKITRKIIALHKNKQVNALTMLINAINDSSEKKNTHGNKTFYQLMMMYHPDRVNFYKGEIDKHFAAKNREELQRYAHIFNTLELEQTLVVLKAPIKNEASYSDMWENYVDDVEARDEAEGEEEAPEIVENEFGEIVSRNSFFTVFKRQMYGNSKIELPFYYLEDIDTIDLPGCGIDDLDGIKYCKHLEMLELSNNQITDVSELASLSMLREVYLANNRIGYIDGLSFLKDLRAVDLSYNNIDDLSPMFALEHLEYVNIAGNDIPKKQIAMLQNKGIIIIS